MTLPLDFLVSALVTLFVVVDPVGLTPAFIGLTAGLPRNSRRQFALRACLIAFVILAGSALIGDKGVRASRPFMRHHQGCRDGAASGPEREPCGVRKLLFLLLLIAPILTTITPICASNAHGRAWITNAGLSVRCGEHRRRHCEACRGRQPQKGKHPSTRNRFRSDLLAHYDLLLGFENRASSWPSVSIGQLMNLMANRERAVSSLGTGRCPLGQFRNLARCAEIVRHETIAESPSAYRSDASRVSELHGMAQAGRVRIMKSPVAKRSVVINGHKTSVSLEDSFWSAAKEIAAERGLTLSQLVAMIDHDRGERANLSSALRLFVLARYRGEPAPAGSQQQEPRHREEKPATS